MPRKKKQAEPQAEPPQAEPQGVEDYLRDILAALQETRDAIAAFLKALNDADQARQEATREAEEARRLEEEARRLEVEEQKKDPFNYCRRCDAFIGPNVPRQLCSTCVRYYANRTPL